MDREMYSVKKMLCTKYFSGKWAIRGNMVFGEVSFVKLEFEELTFRDQHSEKVVQPSNSIQIQSANFVETSSFLSKLEKFHIFLLKPSNEDCCEMSLSYPPICRMHIPWWRRYGSEREMEKHPRNVWLTRALLWSMASSHGQVRGFWGITGG